MAKQNIEGFPIPFGIQSPNKMFRADSYAGPYNSVQDALDTIDPPIRELGREVGVYRADGKGVDIYVFEKDAQDNWALVLDESGKTYTGKLDEITIDVNDEIGLAQEVKTDIQKGVEAKQGLDDKVDKVTGKGLSTNDYTNEDKNKLDGIEDGADVTANNTSADSLKLGGKDASKYVNDEDFEVFVENEALESYAISLTNVPFTLNQLQATWGLRHDGFYVICPNIKTVYYKEDNPSGSDWLELKSKDREIIQNIESDNQILNSYADTIRHTNANNYNFEVNGIQEDREVVFIIDNKLTLKYTSGSIELKGGTATTTQELDPAVQRIWKFKNIGGTLIQCY